MTVPTRIRVIDGQQDATDGATGVPPADEADAWAADVPRLTADRAADVAAELAAEFAVGAAERDAARTMPDDEVWRLAESGLLALTVPSAHGGPDLPVAAVAEVFRSLATGDPNLAQLPHSHYVYLNALRHRGSAEQQEFFFAEALRGRLFGNAQSEIGTKHARDYRTTLTEDGTDWRLDGRKGYSTGALFADWIPVLARLGDGGPLRVAWVERTAPGVTVAEDWDGMGQRTTASGTVVLDRVPVDASRIMPYHLDGGGPQTYGAFAQVLHAAIDAGIARAALDEASRFVVEKSRPCPDAGVDRAADDPLVVQAVGAMEVQTRAAEALLAEGARAVDRANADLTGHSAAVASLAVAAARAATSSAAVEVCSRIFEVAGTRSALDGLNLHRHWRNARTHTLHDAAAWKVQHLGRFTLEGTFPPDHGQI